MAVAGLLCNESCFVCLSISRIIVK